MPGNLVCALVSQPSLRNVRREITYRDGRGDWTISVYVYMHVDPWRPIISMPLSDRLYAGVRVQVLGQRCNDGDSTKIATALLA